MAAPEDAPSALLDAEVIELEPTVALGALHLGPDGSIPVDRSRDSIPVAIVAGPSGGSLAGETNTLRRSRLAAASIFLAVAYTVLLAWILLTGDDANHHMVWVMAAVRLALAATLAVVLVRDVPMTAAQVRWAEFSLFGGLTTIVVISQFVVNRDLLLAGDVPGTVAYMKNGIIQMYALMFLYGVFIPNHWKIAARVILTMSLAPLVSLALLMEHPELLDVIHRVRSIESPGTNFLILLIGAGLAIYGAHVLNGLRVELHDARKFGQYRLLRKIGVGGMGEVYLAEHQLLKRPCALKLIKPEAGANPVALGRFEREVRSAARLSHPNSIEIYDYGHSEDGTFYYVMEYLPGMSLHDLVVKAGPLPAGRAIFLLRQACAGLAEAHSLGLVHRDLKPANIFVARRGGETDIAKVLDFGLVKLTKDPDSVALTSELTVSGTPSYMAPEQATGSQDLDARADVYAMGSVAYFVLTGQPPFAGESAFAIMMAHARDPVVPPSKIHPGIPEDLEKVILTALAKKPEERYPDARSMGRALAACQAARDWDADRADLWWAELDREDAASAGSA
ncbi:serine/threonine-protein kinase [Tundrisphaera lichenicola]|uniref:serine/threonine-protein kinase n=1 Tax=Tundrisphaera lichenicola TaxID=2029860 RepID=UPI003EB7C87E